ncbi:uncharacterized protein METZ01_LOCUS291776 [marine metagenome]|uniref:Uncharacterized protein n=1 Tax=marine metagenome TaxID=408172 RepID=A0A382LV39_9ZZZZ
MYEATAAVKLAVEAMASYKPVS